MENADILHHHGNQPVTPDKDDLKKLGDLSHRSLDDYIPVQAFKDVALTSSATRSGHSDTSKTT